MCFNNNNNNNNLFNLNENKFETLESPTNSPLSKLFLKNEENNNNTKNLNYTKID